MKEEKSKLLQALEAKVKELTCGGMCIAYSGDDGSTLLLKLAADMKARILAVTFRSPRSCGGGTSRTGARKGVWRGKPPPAGGFIAGSTHCVELSQPMFLLQADTI